MMRILGIRTAPKQIRYAILERTDDTIEFVNHDAENLLTFPKGSEKAPEQQLCWLHSELSRILDRLGPFDAVALKLSEFMGGDTKGKRQGSYFDAIANLAAGERNIPVRSYLYTNMKSRSSDVERMAEERVGRTSKNWNTQIADAVFAACVLLSER